MERYIFLKKGQKHKKSVQILPKFSKSCRIFYFSCLINAIIVLLFQIELANKLILLLLQRLQFFLMIFSSNNAILIKVRIILDRIFYDAILFYDLIDRVLNLSKLLLLCVQFDIGQTIEVDRNGRLDLTGISELLLWLLDGESCYCLGEPQYEVYQLCVLLIFLGIYLLCYLCLLEILTGLLRIYQFLEYFLANTSRTSFLIIVYAKLVFNLVRLFFSQLFTFLSFLLNFFCI